MKPSRKTATSVSILLIFLTCLYALSGIMPRAVISESLPENEFSLSRALDHLKVVSENPHYVGSESHGQVRDYLVKELEKLGLDVEIQETQVLGKKVRTGTRVKNILARIRGEGSGQALLLLSHYDSGVSSSHGASDAGSGIVTLLEGLRAYLARSEKPKNDIILLFSDAEEIGLLGAQAFIDKHPWISDVRVVMNFEARGSGGPVLMFPETAGGNERLIRAFDRAGTRHAFTNSLFYSIYRLFPNDTDLTLFWQYGNTQGYNFAFMDDHFDYHTSQDNFERLDRNTLQHEASYLMPALAYLAGTDLDDLRSDKNLVFLNFPGAGLLSYPYEWVLPMALGALILLFVLVFMGVRNKRLSIGAIFRGFAPLVIILALVGLASFYGWKLLLKIHPHYGDMLHGFTYNGHLYVTSFISLSLWITLKIYQRYLKRSKAPVLLIAPLLLWLLISLGLALYLPGGGFFIIAGLTGIVLLSLFLFYRGSQEKRTLFSTLAVLPMLLILVPLPGLFPVALGLRMMWVSTLLATLILMVLLPILAAYPGLKSLNKFFLIVGLLTLASASYSSGFDKESKHPDSIVYLRKEQDGTAYWASRDRQADEFTRQFLGEDPSASDPGDPLFRSAGQYGFTLHRRAEPISLPSSLVTVVSDSSSRGMRHLKLRIEPLRKVNRIEVRIPKGSRVASLSVNGEPALPGEPNEEFLVGGEDSRHLFRYYFSDSGEALEFAYSVPEGDDPSLVLTEISYDLLRHPEIRRILPGLVPRPGHLMEKPFIVNDAILNLRELGFR